jgi:epoxyqueuosine reductase
VAQSSKNGSARVRYPRGWDTSDGSLPSRSYLATVFGRVGWDEEAEFYGRRLDENVPAVIARGEPGYSRIDYARAAAAWTVADHFRGAYSWEKLGGSPAATTGGDKPLALSPAKMSEEIKRAARTYGADLVGIAALDRRWVYAAERDGTPVEIPVSHMRAVVMAIAMDPDAIQASPSFVAAAAVGVGYSRMAFAIACLAEFIRSLGFRAIPMGNDTALSIPLAIDAGLGELGRHGLLVTREYGPCVRICKVFTDMPLTPDEPVSSGLATTCRSCQKCADACEVGAISRDPEPSFEIVCRSNNPGIKRWAVDHDKCYCFWIENGQDCSTCIAACPFTRRGARVTGRTWGASTGT